MVEVTNKQTKNYLSLNLLEIKHVTLSLAHDWNLRYVLWEDGWICFQ